MTLVCPKCGAENADNAYFCAACHAHIRSAFGSLPAVTATKSNGVASERPRSIFNAPAGASVAVAEPAGDAAPIKTAFQIAHPVEPRQGNVEEMAVSEGYKDAAEFPVAVADLSRKKIEPSRELKQLPITPEAPVQPPVTTQKPAPQQSTWLASPPTSAQLQSNTSGMREKAVLPAQAKGWSWAGFVPGGAFGFVVGIPWLGILGLLGICTGRFGLFYLWPLYILIVGAKGREFAWRRRSFESVTQYREMTGAWDKTGLALVIVDIVIYGMVISVSGALNP
jgi:hypothetical protein